ncbi:hypothetical protein SmJEL517_g03159 [Synchytrium microbalum]|uniref:SH3 domain-containing protein n=1 Tax=Synchytrium microbalum TaxID=1806994 RepID=A0A507C4X8_9FUNG|nr:uncharacterized protein SmJEL517_g03159 [Synchytrium microbalum]TPX34169.1 hypothetical protein SmJEL517_g03159 [Synchytrium microbalum]
MTATTTDMPATISPHRGLMSRLSSVSLKQRFKFSQRRSRKEPLKEETVFISNIITFGDNPHVIPLTAHQTPADVVVEAVSEPIVQHPVMSVTRTAPPPLPTLSPEAPVASIASPLSVVESISPIPAYTPRVEALRSGTTPAQTHLSLPSYEESFSAHSVNGITYVVNANYLPQRPDELAVHTGDHVILEQEFHDGWGRCHSVVTGLSGVLPLALLVRLESKITHSDISAQRNNNVANIALLHPHVAKDFHEAAERGDLNKILSLLESSLTVIDARDDGQRTPLIKAVSYGHVHIVKKLLESEALVNARCGGQHTPLHFAITSGEHSEAIRTEIVTLLLQYGANVNAKDGHRQTPLHCASRFGYTNILESLLAEAADVDAKDENGWTALHHASAQPRDDRQDNRFALIDVLLQYGANIDARANDQMTPLHLAAKIGSERVVKLLLDKGASVLARAGDLITPLHLAASHGHAKVINVLADEGALVNAWTNSKKTSLMMASQLGKASAVKTLLLKPGIDVLAQGENGLTALHFACQNGNMEVISLLTREIMKELTRKHGSHVTLNELPKTAPSWTPIHYAALNGHIKAIECLASNGIDINATTEQGWTPFLLACSEGETEVAVELLRLGAEKAARTKGGWSALHLACITRNKKLINTLLDLGMDPSEPTLGLLTPLHLVAESTSVEGANALIAKGAEVNSQTITGLTPLHIASMRGFNTILQLLSNSGADPELKYKNKTARDLATKESTRAVLYRM